MTFPKPWKVDQAGREEYLVTDADGSKLFYIVGDEGDEPHIEPSVLFYNDKEHTALMEEIVRRLTDISDS
jgi:hypothetical protein